MKNILQLLLLFCLIGLSTNQLTAQSAEAPLVFSIKGKAKYTAPGTKSVKLTNGTQLSSKGTLTLKKNTFVGIFYNDAYTYLSGPVTFDLSELNDKLSFKDTYASGRLNARAIEAMHPYYDAVAFGLSGGNTKPPVKDEKDGGGNKDRWISIQSPLVGKVSGQIINFSWSFWEPDADSEWTIKSLKKAYNEFKFVIQDESDKVIHQQIVDGFSVEIDLPAVGCQVGNTYYWSLTATKNDRVDSGTLEMEYTSSEDFQKIQSNVRADDVYQNASPASRLLIEAASYEYFGYLQAASQALQTARKKYRKDPMVIRVHESFIYRWGLE